MGTLPEPFQYIADKVKGAEERINTSTFGRIFRLDGCGHPKQIKGASFFREIRAGMTTFATMAYIIAVNSTILADSGGTCQCPHLDIDPLCQKDQMFIDCKTWLKRDLITATAALAGLSSILFGLVTNLPVALGPGMGLNAYFTYQVVGYHGTGIIPYRIALTAIFVEGWIFLFLALTGMRQWLVKMIPATIKTASGVGIGLFLTEIGLSYSAGIGAITGGVSTPVAIGGCPAGDLNDHGECSQHLMTNPAMWIGICLGGILVAFLMAFRVKSAIMIGILLVSVMSWPRNTSWTYFPDTPAGNERFNFFKQVVAFNPIKNVLAAQQWTLDGTSAGQFALALITFLYVDIIDCTATLYSMAKFCGVVGDDGNFPRSTLAYCTDAVSISIGSLFGCSPVTAFIESGAGIAEGGRTGLTAISTGMCFLVSLFFAPILASIPPWATGSCLVLVGCLMIRQVTAVNWKYIGDAVPSFVTMAFMPFSYSVAYGLIAGMLVYVALNTMIWAVVHLTNGRIEPTNWRQKEVYNWGSGKGHTVDGSFLSEDMVTKKDMPKWLRFIVTRMEKRMMKRHSQEFDPKDIEMVETDSTVRNSSHNGSSKDEDRDVMHATPVESSSSGLNGHFQGHYHGHATH